MSPPATGSAGVIEGYAMLGPLSGATVTAYDAGADGTELAQTVTDADGHYRLTVQSPATAIRLVVTGGHYVEESSGSTVYLSGAERLEALIAYEPGTTITAAITPLTYLAAGLAEYWSNGAPVTPATVIAADHEISSVTGFDVVGTSPLAVSDSANASASLSPGLEYGFMLAALSEFANQAGAAASAASGASYVPNQAPFDMIDMAQAMFDDIRSDGCLDGVAHGVAISLGTIALDTQAYRHGLAVDIVRVAATRSESSLGIPYGNETGLPVAAVFPFATHYNDSTDAIFGEAPPVALAGGGLRIIPAAPVAPSGWVRGTVTLTGSVQDAFGFDPPTIAIAIDGNTLAAPVLSPVAPLASTYAFSQTVNTTAYGPDALHHITESVTDIAGNAQTRAFTLGFDNTPPSGCIQSYGLFNSGYSGSFSGLWSDGSGSGVVNGNMNGVPVTIGAGTWTVPAASAMATVPTFNMFSNVLPVILTLVDGAGNATSFNIFPEPQWSNGGPNPAMCAP